MTAQTTPAVPEFYAQRFAKAFEAFVSEVRFAVNAGVLDPAYSSNPAFLMWQTEALPRLEQELAAVENAFALFQIGETGTIAQLARNEVGLAKQLDGFPLDFAGPEHAVTLDKLQTAVVTAAYQVYSSAGIR
ncbi:MAG TPA: hypothetical protein VME23_09700 [Terracidiphilus sp.]|nr:hypothetical protein [Terracidiphilus sp.]